MRGLIIAALVAVALAEVSGAQTQGAKTDGEIKTEETQAQALVDKQNYFNALPLYEDLHTQRPQSLVYEERLAFSLLASASQQTPEAAKATRLRAKNLLLDARAHGDNSNLLQILLERLNQEETVIAAPKPEGHEWVEKGEVAFAKGDFTEAVADYKKAFDLNSKYYAAALFAGDAEYKLNHPGEAGAWFAKAISIDPNIETAYRYWGDCLEKNGERQQAEQEFIGGIVADPYSRAPRVGLKQWADANHAIMVPPPIKLPARAAKGVNGNVNITIDSSQKDSAETSMALMYSMNSALWQGDKFKKQFPNQKSYRHSLAEEIDGIHTMLSIVKEQKIPETKLSTSTKLLMELDAKGMLECWVLLDNPDQGIAQDYVAYRAAHRDLLEKYIAAYDVHAM